jgi:cytochrome c-type biogenesis protein CcmH
MNGAGRPPGGSRDRASTVTLLLIASVLAVVASLAYLALRGPAAPTDPQARTRAVAETLRCPSCQNLSVADSPSPIAAEIRRDIARRLAAGQTPAQVRAYYAGRYGTWILLSPPKSGVTLVAWLVPGMLLGGGVMMVLIAVRRWTAAGSGAELGSGPRGAGALSAPDRRLLDRALAAEDEAE